MRRLRITPHIDVGLNNTARVIHVVSIKTGAMSFVLADNLKATNRCAVPFATTGYARRRSFVPSTVEIGFLCP